MEVFITLQQAGKIRYYGVSNLDCSTTWHAAASNGTSCHGFAGGMFR
jgi:aryl-alcohol dehydrogenase-like predicted oxidoreductase